MIKRITAVALLLALVVCGAVPVLAGTALTAEIRKASDYAHVGLVTEDAIYIMGANDLYVWRDGDKGMSVYTGVDLPGMPLEAFERGGNLWLVIYSPYGNSTTDITFARVKTESDGRYTVPETVVMAVPNGALLPGEKLDITSAVCVGDTLYMLVRADYGEAQFWAFDWTKKTSSVLRNGKLGRRLFAAPGERLLVECMDSIKGTAWYEMYDPEKNTFTARGGVFKYDREHDGMVGVAWDSLNDLLFYQRDGELKCAPNLEPSSEITVTTITHPVDSMSYIAGITAKKDYAFLTREGPIVVDLDDSLNRVVTFKVVMPETIDAVVQTLQEMEKRHPDLATAIDSQKYTDQQLASQFTMQRDDADIYIVEVDNIFPMMLYLRDYLQGIAAPEIIKAVSKMYPAVRGCIEKGNKVIAVPVSVEGDTLGINRDVLEELAGKGAELPTNFVDLAEKLKELNENCGDNEEYSIFPLRMSADAIRVHMLFYILSVYGKVIEEDPKTGFNTPELNDALNALMDMDLEIMGINEESRAKNNVFDVKPLISGGASTVCEQYNRECEPLPLTLFPDRVPILPIDMKVAIINPNSRNKELANEFMTEVLKHLDDTTLYTISGEKNDPIPDPQIQEAVQSNIENRDMLFKMLDSASGIEKEELDNLLERIKRTIENMKVKIWKLSPESIERFRANADKMYITTYNYAVTGDAASLLRSLLDRRITVEEFTKELDNRTKMLILEGF